MMVTPKQMKNVQSEDTETYDFGKLSQTDKYTIEYKGELCNKYTREYVKEIIYEQQRWKYKCTIADQEFSYMHEEYHKSEDLTHKLREARPRYFLMIF